MDYLVISFLADVRDNDELEVDDCWAAKTDDEGSTRSDTGGDLNDDDEVVGEQVAVPVAELVAEQVANKLLNKLLHRLLKVAEPVVEPLAEPIAQQVALQVDPEAPKAARFAAVRKRCNRGQGSRKSAGKEIHFTPPLSLSLFV